MADSILFLVSFIAFGWLCIWSIRAPKSRGWSPFEMPDADEPPPPPPPPPPFGRSAAPRTRRSGGTRRAGPQP